MDGAIASFTSTSHVCKATRSLRSHRTHVCMNIGAGACGARGARAATGARAAAGVVRGRDAQARGGAHRRRRPATARPHARLRGRARGLR